LGSLLAGGGLGLAIAYSGLIGIGSGHPFGHPAAGIIARFSGTLIAVVLSIFALRVAGEEPSGRSIMLAAFCLSGAILGNFFVTVLPLQPAQAVLSGQQLLASLMARESIGLVVASLAGAITMTAAFAAIAENRVGAVQAQEADRLRYQMRHDPLTDLPNRFFLFDCLREATAVPEREQLAVLVVDLDRFKLVNELYGRHAGDQLLRETAARLRNVVGSNDIIGRMGGDKFAILHRAQAGPATVLSREIIRALQEPLLLAGQNVVVGASIGIANCPASGTTAEILLQDAETALQQARSQGGGQFCQFEAGMRQEQEARNQLERDFRQAIEARQFVVYYQPLFDAEPLRLRGFEALVRWMHPERGIIGPNEFIPFAEKSGLINSLGLWVLETACAEAASWPDPLRVAINISPVQLQVGDVVGMIDRALQKSGLPAQRLELEVTESAIIENPVQAKLVLSRLKDIGVQIAIDDFGTGYSSLSYLRYFPFDRIKIDRSFIQNLEDDSDVLLIVRAIINLGHSLRVDVLAEGIETQQQLHLLRAQSCDQLQGFLLGEPAPVASAISIIKLHLDRLRQGRPTEATTTG
jgi:diguanylate cyclase (GGDEF)-like protein